MTEIVNTRINGNWDLLLPKRRADRAEWATGWERERLDAEHKAITSQEHPIVYCVGAEEGDFPALYAQWGAEVVLVEPNPKVWSNIRTIFEANGYQDSVLGSFVGFASRTNAEPSGNQRDNFSFKEALIKGNAWPWSAYLPVIPDHGFRHTAQETDTTPQVTIDRLAIEFGAPDIITMDIEGAELWALEGAAHVLTTYRPIVFLSVHESALRDFYNLTPQHVYDFMSDAGYNREVLAIDHEEHCRFTPR